MCFFATLVLAIASVMSFNHKPVHMTVIPNPQYTIFGINSLSALFALILVIFPTSWKTMASLLLFQSISTTLTGYDTLGTFLYSGCIILCFCNGFFKTRLKLKILIFIIIWMLVLAGYGFYALNNDNPEFIGIRGLYRLILEIAISIFFFGFYFYIYKKLEVLLVTLVPAKNVMNTNEKLPKPGSTLYLSDFNLTERQTKLVLEYLNTQKNYEALSEQFYISKSTVKKDMTEVFEKFSVTNLKELHILLLQYIVKA